MERARARLAHGSLDKLGRAYDGASKGRRTDGWMTSGSSANSETTAALKVLLARSRDLCRNNPFAARARQAIVSNVVGTGVMTQFKGPNAKRSEKVMALWKKWAETTQCDADGVNNIYGLQALAMATVFESGACLVRRRNRLSSDGFAVPMQLQILEPDFLDTTKDRALAGGRTIVGGIQFDLLGRKEGYWIFPQHPGDRTIGMRGFESRFVPASEIRYVYRQDRSGQVQGVPWLAPVMLRLKDFDDYEDAQILKQKVSSCFVAFYEDIEMSEIPAETEEDPSEKLEPGAIERCPPGKRMSFATPPPVQGFSEFAQVALQGVASGLGLTYPLLAGDYSKVNFSSGKMGWIETQRNFDAWQWNLLIPQFCQPVTDWFLAAASLSGSQIDGLTPDYSTPRREMIDPTREIPGIIAAIRSGLMTWSEAVRQFGLDPDAQREELESDALAFDKKNIILDCDPRKTAGSGVFQPAQPAEGVVNA